MIAPGDVLLDRYVIEALIARGGMADVFLARDRRLDRHVAIKAFRLGTTDPARFDAETRLLAGLSHRNLVSVFDAGEHDDVPFVVLQYVPGHTLATHLAAGPLPTGALTRLAGDVSAALEYVHAQRIVHRDVKPSNIFLHPDGRSMLGDFGVAMLLDATRFTTDAAIIGTAGYLAPEQVTGDKVTERADVYALGLVLLECLTGLPAFAGSFQEVITAKLGRDPLVPVGLEEPWPALLSAMTNRDPDLRPSAAAVRHVLHNGPDADTVVGKGAVVEPASAETVVLGDQERSPTQIAPAASRVVPGPSRRRRRAVAAVAAGVVALVVVFAVLAAGGGDGERLPAKLDGGGTSVPTPSTVVATMAPSTTRQDVCADLERHKQAIEREKQSAERTYRDDKELLERVKNQLEEKKKDIEGQKKAAGC